MAKLVSKVYGDALFEAAQETKCLDETFEQVLALQEILKEHEDLIQLLNHPQVVKEEKIQIIERDSAGYVKRAQIGNMDYTGDEVRDSLGLASSCLYFSSADGKIRVSSKGIGGGYGFSQAGADAMEREQGGAFQELLKYYFQGIEIVKIAE